MYSRLNINGGVMVARAKSKGSVNIPEYLNVGITKLIEKEPFRSKSAIINEALDMFLKTKGVIKTDDAEKQKD